MRILTAALIAILSPTVAAFGQIARPRVEPRNAANAGAHASPALILPCTDSTDAPWSALGLSGRPVWVSLCAERRLRLLPALPKMKQDIDGDVAKYFGSQGPGLAVGLVLDDGLFYSQGFGFRDAQKTHAPDEITVFRAGSLSKVITGTALLTLIDDPARHMSLDDPADDPKYLPELEFVCPASNAPAWAPCARGTHHLGIKLKDLVSHTAGLADVMEQTKADIPTWLSDLKKSWLLFPPEKYSSYSGVAIEGVGLIEQRVSGALSYPAFVEKNLFAPLGMTHSTMDPVAAAANISAHRWRFNLAAPYTSWSFTSDNSMLAGDDQPMILPAGGLATDVWDLARFMKMWLSGSAPSLNGHPLLKPATLKSADQPQVNFGVPPPASCGNSSDPNGFYYSGCGPANGFGVNWYVGNKPYIMHNGDEPGYSGSETMIDQGGKIAATGLVSTEPYPNVPSGKTQPSGLDGSFIDTVVWGRLMNEGHAADKVTTWKSAALSIGVARLLWLSGIEPPASGIAGPQVHEATTRPPLVQHPNVRPARKAGQESQKTPVAQYDAELLDQFTAGFRSQNHLTTGNVRIFVQDTFAGADRCSTFRVRRLIDADKAALRFLCRAAKGSSEVRFDATVTVDAAGRIAALHDTGVTSEAY